MTQTRKCCRRTHRCCSSRAEGIEELNESTAKRRATPRVTRRTEPDGAQQGPFFLFHRPRRWNAQERVWMGFERKRGKLADLNALLRGTGNAFSLVVGNTALLSG